MYDVHITSGEIESVTAFHRSIIPSLEFTLTKGKVRTFSLSLSLSLLPPLSFHLINCFRSPRTDMIINDYFSISCMLCTHAWASLGNPLHVLFPSKIWGIPQLSARITHNDNNNYYYGNCVIFH